MSNIVRVLIVDDQTSIRTMLKSIITELGSTVAGEAADGFDAIEKYSTLKPDAVLMDINMPRMNGIDALKKIRELDPKATIIMLTSQNTLPIVRECIASGAKNFLLKSNTPDTLMKELRGTFSSLFGAK